MDTFMLLLVLCQLAITNYVLVKIHSTLEKLKNNGTFRP